MAGVAAACVFTGGGWRRLELPIQQPGGGPARVSGWEERGRGVLKKGGARVLIVVEKRPQSKRQSAGFHRAVLGREMGDVSVTSPR